MDLVVITRLLCFAAWLWVFVYMSPAVWRLWNGSLEHSGPARLVCWGFALLMMAFCARWFVMPDSKEAFAALYVFGSVWAGLTLHAARSYGR